MSVVKLNDHKSKIELLNGLHKEGYQLMLGISNNYSSKANSPSISWQTGGLVWSGHTADILLGSFLVSLKGGIRVGMQDYGLKQLI